MPARASTAGVRQAHSRQKGAARMGRLLFNCTFFALVCHCFISTVW